MIPEARSCIGAWARYMLPRWPTLTIDVDYEPGTDRPDCSRTMATLGLHTGEIINITALIPWAGPDPRGQDHELRQWVWEVVNGKTKLVPGGRAPHRLQTLLYRRDVDQPSVLDRHAQIATIRAQRDIDRGYPADLILEGQELRASEHYRDRPALPPSSMADHMIGWVREGRQARYLARVDEVIDHETGEVTWMSKLTVTLP